MQRETPARPAALSNPAPIYVVGLFGMGYTDFYIFLIPLYGLSLGMNASQIGLLVGGRSLLAVFLSIHVGVLIYIGRFSFYARIGTTAAPILAGLAWDLGGA